MSNKGKELEIFPDRPWERQPGEEDWEWEVFRRIRDSDPLERVETLKIVAAELGKSVMDLKICGRERNWTIRLKKYDLWLDTIQRQSASSRKKEIGREMVKYGSELMTKGNQFLSRLENEGKTPSYREAIELFRIGLELARSGFTAQGVTDEVHQGSNEGPGEWIAAATEVEAIIRKRTTMVRIEDVVNAELESRTIEGEVIRAEERPSIPGE